MNKPDHYTPFEKRDSLGMRYGIIWGEENGELTIDADSFPFEWNNIITCANCGVVLFNLDQIEWKYYDIKSPGNALQAVDFVRYLTDNSYELFCPCCQHKVTFSLFSYDG